jgi:hypothetical protein
MSSQVRLTRNYVSRLQKIISGLEFIPRNVHRFPFDSMATQSMSKAFALAKAILLLIDRGFPDEAYGLSRSLVECSVGLRYITADPEKLEERTREFVYYDQIEQNYWLDQSRRHLSDPALRQEIESSQLAKELDARHLNPKDAYRHWSTHRAFIWEAMTLDHLLDGTTNTPQQRKQAYAVDYHAPSQYVHCSQRGLNNYFHDPARVYAVSEGRTMVADETAPKALFIVCMYLHLTVCYALFGLNVDRPKKVDKLFSKAIAPFVSSRTE